MQSRQVAEPAILLVDDERQTLKYFERAFAKDFKIKTAASADEAEAMVDADPAAIGLVISDQRMPARSGVSLLNAIRQKHPLIVRMLTTAYSELDDAIEAVNRGEIFRYIVKPWNFDLLRQEMKTGLMVYSLQIERDMLVGEKLHVRQRMVAVDRARDLAIIASGLTELRTAPLAVDDYVRDGAQSLPSSASISEKASLDMWALPQNEAAFMGAVAREAAQLVDLLRSGREQGSALDTVVGAAVTAASEEAQARGVSFAQVPASGLSVAVDREVAGIMFANTLSAIIQGTAQGGTIKIAAANGAMHNGAPGATVSIVTDKAENTADPMLYASSAVTGQTPGRLFAAYLAARESGGSLRVRREGGLTAEVALPASGVDVTAPAVRSDWLARLFQHFESWPG